MRRFIGEVHSWSPFPGDKIYRLVDLYDEENNHVGSTALTKYGNENTITAKYIMEQFGLGPNDFGLTLVAR